MILVQVRDELKVWDLAGACGISYPTALAKNCGINIHVAKVLNDRTLEASNEHIFFSSP